KLASADRAAADMRLTDMDFRLLWLLLSASDRKTGIVRRKQRELAQTLGVTARGVQVSRDRLGGCGYLAPIRKTPGGYVSALTMYLGRKRRTCIRLLKKAILCSPPKIIRRTAQAKKANLRSKKTNRHSYMIPCYLLMSLPARAGLAAPNWRSARSTPKRC